MARMNANRQKLLFLIMRHAGGFIINNNNNNHKVRVNDDTAAQLIGLDLNNTQNRTAFQINGFDKTANANLGAAVNVNLHHTTNGSLAIPNVTIGNDGNNNLPQQLNYINWLLDKIDVSCMDNDIINRLFQAGFVKTGRDTNNNLIPTGLKITTNPNSPTAINHIDDKLKLLFLMLPDLQYVHRKQLTTDPRLKIEFDKKRANYSRFGSNINEHDWTDSSNRKHGQQVFNLNEAVNAKIHNSISYAGINSTIDQSKKNTDPALQININNNELNAGNNNTGNNKYNYFRLNEITMHQDIVDTHVANSQYMIRSETNIIQALDSQNQNNYKTQININNAWQDYNQDNQQSNCSKDFRDWMLEKFDAVLKTKTQQQQNNFKQRLYRKRTDAADNNANPPKPQAAFNKANINYILNALGDTRLQLKSDVNDNFCVNNNEDAKENAAKTYILENLRPIIDRANNFISSKQIRETITNPASKQVNSLFKVYTKDLGSEEANRQELNDFFSKRLSKDGLVYHPNDNPNGIIKSYKVFQPDNNDRLVEIIDRDNHDYVPENARSSIVKTTMKFRVPVKNPSYSETAGNNHNDPNRHHHTLTIDRYHKKHGNHQKNEYDIHLTDNQGNRVPSTANNLTLGHFLDIARTMSAKHTSIDLRKLPDTRITVKAADRTFTNIPIKWVMFAAFEGINYPGKLKIIPSSIAELRRIPGGGEIAGKLETLINIIQGANPENTAVLNMNMGR